MLKKITNIISDEEPSKEENHINKLNILLYALISFISIYVLVLIYQVETNTESIQHTQKFLNTVVTLPATIQIAGHTNETNVAVVSTNITKEPTQIKIDDRMFTIQKSYNRGDIVLVKFFNIYGVVEDKSAFSKDYYKVFFSLLGQITTILCLQLIDFLPISK
jgi:hypothetical protein